MNIFESIKSKNIDELADWIDKHFDFDNAQYWQWWDDKYCSKCESETFTYVDNGNKGECAYCELNGNCKFFKDMRKIPDNKQIIKMWLESECK